MHLRHTRGIVMVQAVCLNFVPGVLGRETGEGLDGGFLDAYSNHFPCSYPSFLRCARPQAGLRLQ